MYSMIHLKHGNIEKQTEIWISIGSQEQEQLAFTKNIFIGILFSLY